MFNSDEGENLCFFGKCLQPYDEDAIPNKRPIAIEEQTAKDAQGRRRFHGAFTGGFSAGFFNTVGSLDGWRPSNFKSSRQEKSESKLQKPEDFMDDEDIGEFGIAPQTVKATKEFSTNRKRKKQILSDGPIPGEPVLHTLLESGNETVGYMLLKNISLKDKQPHNNSKVYGCEMPVEIDDLLEEEPIPQLYKQYKVHLKCNTFGLGYSGLETIHVPTFKSSKLIMAHGKNKTISISGQAFGVGAFETDDQDIYMKDDMSNYDFEMTTEPSKATQSKKEGKLVHALFIASKSTLLANEVFPPPTIPHSFTGKYKVRKSRFEPIVEERKNVERKSMNCDTRAELLLEKRNVPKPAETSTVSCIEINADKSVASSEQKPFDLIFDRFVASTTEDNATSDKAVVMHGTREMQDAAKINMFGPLTRISLEWQPSSLLCKRFNLPEPLYGETHSKADKKRTKHLIFEYETCKKEEDTLKPGLSMPKNHEVVHKLIETTRSAPEDQDSNVTESVPQLEESALTLAVNKIPVETCDETTKNNREDPTHITLPPVLPPLDITEKVDVFKNLDLFKAVFFSDSEPESEPETNEEQAKEIKEDLARDLVPKFKPTKIGLLSNINFHKYTATQETEPKEALKTEEDVVDTYGPKLPGKLQTVVASARFAKGAEADDIWVEKTEVKSHKHRKEKKQKKDKKKHKKREKTPR